MQLEGRSDNKVPLQYDRYQIAKQERNVSEATSCLCEMLQNPEGSDYPELKQEKRAIVDVIRFEDEDASGGSRSKVITSGRSTPVVKLDEEGRSFLRSLFHSLSASNKHKILMSVAKESEASWYDLCQLMIITLRMFPSEIRKEGSRLVQQIDRAMDVDARNKEVYINMLIFDALPLILHPESGVDFVSNMDELRIRLLSVFQYFTRNSAITDPNADAVRDEEIENKMTGILVLAFQKMSFNQELVHITGESIDVSLIRLSNAFADLLSRTSIVKVEASDAPMDLSVPAKRTSSRDATSPILLPPHQQMQLLFSSLLLFLKCLIRYSRESRESQSVLIEIPHQASGNLIKAKIIPHHATASSSSSSSGILLPEIVSRSSSDQRLRSAFLTCVKCIDMIINPGTGIVHDFFTILKSIGAEESPAYQELRRDACFYKGQHEDFIHQTVQIMSLSAAAAASASATTSCLIKQMIQLISASLIIHDYKSAIHHSISAIQNLSSLPASRRDEEEEYDAGSKGTSELPGYRVFQFLPLTREAVFQFCHECILTCLRYTTLLSLKPSDAGIGHLIVLSQYKWPKYVDVFKSCVSLIRKPLDALPGGRSAQPQIQRFTYFPFMDYVRHPDMLEEFMSLCVDERLQLELSSGASTIKSLSTAHRQMTTRGVNKGAKEEVRVSLVKQMTECKEELDRDVYIEFIVNVLRLMN